MESETPEAGSQSITTTDCEYCGKPFKEGDSYTVDGDGKIVRCLHWPTFEAHK